MAVIKLKVNQKPIEIEVDPKMPLLWVIRDYLDLTGTKFGCGIGQCGACTILVEGKAIRSCLTPVESMENREITTIEGLSQNNDHPVQQAWISEQVPQCGYCQSGQILNAVALLDQTSNPTDAEIDNAMNSVICRCGTYPRIKKAIKTAGDS